MASDGETMTFFAFPREIRDLIYSYLTLETRGKTFTIISATAFCTSDPDFGIINASKAVQHEMLEGFSPTTPSNSRFRARTQNHKL